MTGAVVLLLRLLALVALYAFLGLALWVMWRTLLRGSETGGLAAVPRLRLEIRHKGQHPLLRVFGQPEVLVGRDPMSDVALKDRAVSTRHARFSFHDGQWWIDDLDSTNGTRLNRERLLGPTVLTSGDEVKCGSSRLLVTLPSEGGLQTDQWGGQDE